MFSEQADLQFCQLQDYAQMHYLKGLVLGVFYVSFGACGMQLLGDNSNRANTNPCDLDSH